MTIAFDMFTEELWIQARKQDNLQVVNSHLISTFNNAFKLLQHKYNGVLKYYKSTKQFKLNSHDILEYSETTPFARMFKVSPKGYFLYNYEPYDLWKRHSIDNNIISKYTYETNKYTQPDKTFTIQHQDYILFCLQANATYLPHSFNVRGLFDIVKWSKEHSKPVYFKLHPHTKPDSHIYKLWQKLKDNGYITDITVLIDSSYNLDHLIDNSLAVWTFSSGAGFQAILKNKPVSHFYQETDYATIANFVSTPEQAFLSKQTNEEDKLRYLSWYYHKLTMDVTSNTFVDRLDERFYQVFEKRLKIDQIF
jgi:hypothetical protein